MSAEMLIGIIVGAFIPGAFVIYFTGYYRGSKSAWRKATEMINEKVNQ